MGEDVPQPTLPADRGLAQLGGERSFAGTRPGRRTCADWCRWHWCRATGAARQEKTDIPIVMISSNLVGLGFFASLAQP